MRDHDDRTHVLHQLFSMITNVLGSPPLPIPFPIPNRFAGATVAPSSSSAPSPPPLPRVSPIGFAGLFIGISFALMLFGSAIFVIGFMLMPLVIALVMLFYLARVVSNLSYLASIVIVPSSKIVTAYIQHVFDRRRVWPLGFSNWYIASTYSLYSGLGKMKNDAKDLWTPI